MANLHFAKSEAPLRTVQEIQFGLLSPEEIKNMSVAHILYPETMDEGKMRPRDSGLNDPRLGSIDRGFKCATCDEGMAECPGHFGHIELAKPVYHPGFLKNIKKLLEIVCFNCGKILLDKNNVAYAQATKIRDPKRRFEAIWKLCKAKMKCETDQESEGFEDFGADPKAAATKLSSHGGCGNAQPTVRRTALQLWGTWKKEKGEDDEDGRQPEKREITAEEALNVFRNISTEDIYTLGLNSDYARPEWMIITVLPVPPPPVRPSISMDGTGQGMRGEDDLTYKLAEIIRANGNVKQALSEGSPKHVAEEFQQLLQYHVATYMDNDIAGQPQSLQKSGRPVKSIRARLKGKEGRLRSNLMGKRVDFSARTVITGDPNLALDQVGVPISIARVLTYPETVTRYNITRLHKLVMNGPNNHPGARYVVRNDGSRIDLRHISRGVTLEYGNKVERHLQDDDYIIFNRQPSLHKESMMGHRVKVMPYSTFRLNLSVTSPYNADFDGDEMNLHVPQSEETRAEINQLCMVPLQIVSPQRNGPLMGIVQDTLAGVYKLTRRDVFLTKEQMMNILLWVPNWNGIIPMPAILKPRPRWTGKQLMSMVIPKEVNKADISKGWSPLKDDGILIQEGELMFGLVKKAIVGASAGGIIHIIFNELGWEEARNFFSGCQQVVNYWLLHNGFSIGIGDTIPDKKTVEKIEHEIKIQKDTVEELLLSATTNQLEALPGMTVRDTFESKVSLALNKARDQAGSRTEEGLKDLNNAVTMAKSGSKGSTINIAQMSALVGQQSVEGKRIPFGFKDRSLPHFTKDDYSPESRGFVENSYLRGLTPSEFFFHAMAGREGLIDTAVKTAETGYIQRRLVKALEDVMVKYDGTVRNSLGDIVEFIYGEDGLDAVHIEKQKVDIVNISDKKFENMFRLDVMDQANPLPVDKLEHANDLMGDVEVQHLLDEEYEALVETRELLRTVSRVKDGDDSLQIPLNIQRIIFSAQRLFRQDDTARSDLHPTHVIPAVRNLLDKLVIVRGNDPISREADYNATLLVKAQIRSWLAYKRVAIDLKMSRLAFDKAVGEFEARFTRSLVNPGEMVGILAAQSIGEPATQMTLNTFHFAGVSSKNVTLGVPRLKEILNLAENIKTPTMSIYQDVELGDVQGAQNLRAKIEHTNLRSVTYATEIYYDPDPQNTTIPQDQDIVDSHYMVPDDPDKPEQSLSRWVLRIILDRQKILDTKLSVESVAAKIKEEYPDDLEIIFSDNNAEELVIRCRMIMAGKTAGDFEDDDIVEQDVSLKKLENHMLDTIILRGVKDMHRAFLDKNTRLMKQPDGSLLKVKDDDRCTEWFLNTSGTNLREVLRVPGVDARRTYTNHFIQVLDVLGIEAVRSCLMRELTQVLAFDGSYVNHRHLALLVDIMTSRGRLMAITRHGINRSDTGALMRCSFEETVEILLEAAACGELDDCRGVSENIILGQMAPLGTGEMELMLDPKMLETVVSDNGAMGLGGADMPMKGDEYGAATPYGSDSPMVDSGYIGTPDYTAGFSPISSGGSESPNGFGGFTEYGGMTPSGGYGGSMASPYSIRSPGGGYSPTSPFAASPGFSPTSPAHYTPTSPAMNLSTSPSFSPSSPMFTMGPTSPEYSPTSPQMRQEYSPTSPQYSPGSPTSPKFSPTSPEYSPTSPAFNGGRNQVSPTSPNYSPTSPQYSPTSPQMTSPKYSPTSPAFSPTSPNYSPTSPTSPR